MGIKILKPENYSTGLLRQIQQKIGMNDVVTDIAERKFFDPDVSTQIQEDGSKFLSEVITNAHPTLRESLEKLEDMPVLILTKSQDPENHFKVKFTKNKLTDE